MVVKPVDNFIEFKLVPGDVTRNYLTDDMAFDLMQYRREIIEEFERNAVHLRSLTVEEAVVPLKDATFIVIS